MIDYNSFIYQLLKKIFVFPIRFYQKFLSPAYPRNCRFYPTCSSYAATAIIRFGILIGGLMALFRFFRCNPFCKSGYDPVPDQFSLYLFATKQQIKFYDKIKAVTQKVKAHFEEKKL